MSQQQDWVRIYDLIEQMERDLSLLKLALPVGADKRRKTVSSKRAKRTSLYGVFAPTKATLADFRMARKSWTREQLDS